MKESLRRTIGSLKTLWYKHNELKIFYVMNKRSIVTINTPFGETGNIEIEQIVKQGTTYGPVMYCATTARVNDIGEIVVSMKTKKQECQNL